MSNQVETIQTTPVHRSLIRPDRDHVVGAERTLIVALATVAFILGWLLISWPTTILAIVLMVVGVPALRSMAKRDPVLSTVLIRRLNQQKEYPAWAHTTGNIFSIKPQQRD